MREFPELDVVREAALELAVREAIGQPIIYVEDGPDLATGVLAEIWRYPGADPALVRPYCAVMAMATDGLRAARASLLIHDLGGVFASLRRTHEMDTLAMAFGHVPGERDRWLRGGQVSQSDLRRRIQQANPALAEILRTSHNLLSNQVHGRTQSLSAYENVRGDFAWPPVAAEVDPARIRAAYAAILGNLMSHFSAIRWQIGDWTVLSDHLEPTVAGYYDALVDFIQAHLEHGEWRAIAPGGAAGWLGEAEE